jgi:hypothetical protein
MNVVNRNEIIFASLHVVMATKEEIPDKTLCWLKAEEKTDV